MLPIFLLLGLVFKQPDLGSTTVLILMGFGLLFIAGMQWTYLVGMIGVGGLLFLVSTWTSAYRQRRILAYLNPWADPQGSGFQSIQSFVAIYSGKIFGTGIGNGNSKLFYLPEVHTDFIFSLISEELGFLGAVCILFLFAYLGYLLFRIARYAPDTFGRLLAFGLALGLSIQTTVNLMGVTGLIPVKGLPLPFISWGRSALIVNLAMIGILLSIARQSERPSTISHAQSV
jgi:cell division protein FtsW